MENVFYVYMLKNPKSGALYYGFSTNLRQRFEDQSNDAEACRMDVGLLRGVFE